MHARGFFLLALCAFPLAAGAALTPVDLPQARAGLLFQDHAGTPVWSRFARQHAWRVADWDRFHAYPHRVLGGQVVLPGGPIADAQDLDTRLRAFLAAHPDLLSGGVATGANLGVSHIGRHGQVWYAHYDQLWRGHRVEESELSFRVSPDGRILMAGSDMHPDLKVVEPRLDRAGAEAAARALDCGSPIRHLEGADWVVLPWLGAKGYEFRSAWPFQVALEDPEQVWRVFLDGQTGEILWSWNEVRHVTVQGQLQGLLEEQQPSDPEVAHILPHLNLTVGGQPVVTDDEGAFQFETNAPAPWTVSGGLLGSFADVQRQDGPDGAFSFQMAASGQVLTVGSSHAQVVELDAYHHTNRVHSFIKGIDPSFTGLDEPLVVRVNLNQTCNAYWDGSSINFFAEGGGCPNTGQVAGVLYHEYGHGINDRQYRQAGAPWGMTNGAMHEGLADVTCIYLQDLNYVAPGWFIRDLDNSRHYPEDILNEVHYDGEILGGAMYDLRQSLGLDIVRPLHHFARWGRPDDSDLGRASFEYFVELLVADDDNGDLADLSPHYEQINAAFNLHGVGSDLTWMSAEFELGDPPVTWEPGVALPLEAILSVPAFVNPSSVEVIYWSQDLPEQTLVLQDEGDGRYTGELPGQPWNTVLQYYARVVNPAGVEITTPAGAPEARHRTRFIWSAGLVVDFEQDPAGAANNELWQWGEPEDGPGGAYDGEACWGTNLTGNYPDLALARLVLDPQEVDDDEQVIVRLHHWMDLEEGWDGVNVELAFGDSEDWQLLTPLSGYDFNTPENNILPDVPALTGATEGWETLVFDLTESTLPGDVVRLRLNLFTDTAVNAAGWYVDQVEYLGFAAPSAIEHDPLGDSEDGELAAFPVVARVNGSATLESFTLRYRVDEGGIQQSELVFSQGQWSGQIPGPFWNQEIRYQLEAHGEGGFHAFLPANPELWFTFRVGTDQTPPSVVFTQAPADAAGWSAIWDVRAQAGDNLDLPLEMVRLEWRPAAGTWQELVDLQSEGDGLYSAQVDFNPLGDLPQVEFRLLARDASQAGLETVTEPVAVDMGAQQLLSGFEDPRLQDWDIDGIITAQQLRVHDGAWGLGTGETGFYEPNTAGVALWTGSLDLRRVEDPQLRLWETWYLENGDDVAWIEVSTDGEDWEQLAERTNGHNWVQSSLPLSEYVGAPALRVRFGFQADGDSDGLHIGYFADQLELVNGGGSAVEEPLARQPRLALGEPWPNPFNPVCRVEVESVGGAPLQVAVHNLLGQEVLSVHQGVLPAGRHVLTVDGSRLASGMYLLVAEQGGRRAARRLLLVK